ncbi:Protein of unknown function DUF616 [Dillenia turbinata]|uniref:Uncharacterized protein n=1 Tax=Dillenia turbinata TaxID=194707 RepID=A0AAN8ZR93_9MAGN
MTGGPLGSRTGSYGSLQLPLHMHNGILLGTTSISGRKSSTKMLISYTKEKEKARPNIWRYLCRRKVAMMSLVMLAALVFISGSNIISKDTEETISSWIAQHARESMPQDRIISTSSDQGGILDADNISLKNIGFGSQEDRDWPPPPPLPPPAHHVGTNLTTGHVNHPCENFAFPPPPPANRRRIGPRPCPVCYVPVEQAITSMPSSQSASPILRDLNYIHEENPIKTEPHGGSDFGGFPTLKQRDESFEIKDSMTVHCGFVRGSKPGIGSGFNIDEADISELEQFHEVIVASAIFGNYDIIQQPQNISNFSREKIPFYMFIDEETEAYMKNSSLMDDTKRVGIWRIIVVHNVPFSDARRNGKIPKLLLHRLFPSVRYSVWIDGKLQLVVDPYQILERQISSIFLAPLDLFLWRKNATFAISRHYRRFDVFEEAEANKAAGKYDNASIDYQINFYKAEGLTPYSEDKLPITSDVPEGCVIIREHIPITNLFTCLWFNEVDRFTSRDQLSFSTVRDKIMSTVDWSLNMFLDCERRNFVIQAYHRELLEHMPPPVARVFHPPPSTTQGNSSPRTVKTPTKSSSKRGKERRSRRHRKAIAAIALSCGAFMMIYTNDFFVFGHGKETATKLSGSTPHDQLLIKTSDSFSGLLLFAIGFLLFMVAFVRDREFQSFFAKGCVILHVIMAIWRVYFERKLEDLARDLPRQVVGDIVLALSWVFFLVYSWREKYD